MYVCVCYCPGAASGGVTALHIAVAAGRGDVARALLVGGARVDPRDAEGGVTPLMVACQECDMEMISLLVSHKVSDQCDLLMDTGVHTHAHSVGAYTHMQSHSHSKTYKWPAPS